MILKPQGDALFHTTTRDNTPGILLSKTFQD